MNEIPRLAVFIQNHYRKENIMSKNGFDNAINYLNDMKKKSEQLSKKDELTFAELFTSKFMIHNTNFNTLEKFLESGKFNASTNESFNAIPEDKLDEFISSNSKFSSWDDMLSSATEEYISKQLGF